MGTVNYGNQDLMIVDELETTGLADDVRTVTVQGVDAGGKSLFEYKTQARFMGDASELARRLVLLFKEPITRAVHAAVEEVSKPKKNEPYYRRFEKRRMK